VETFEAGNVSQAIHQLKQLAEEHPRSKTTLSTLIEMLYEEGDWRGMAQYSERLYPFQRGEDQAITLYNLMGAYMNLSYPALGWQTARELIRRHPHFPENPGARELMQSAEEFLRLEATESLAEAGLSEDEQMKALVEHDQMRFYTETSQPEKAIETAESLLEKAPNFIPVLNNLTLAYFIQGEMQNAIETGRRILEQAADNAHALANLTRIHFLIGDFETAEEYAARLKENEDDDPDVALKQAEALSYLGDDAGILAAYHRVQEQKDFLSPILLHLAAAAHYRSGEIEMAWDLWEEALERQRGFELARQNLADRAVSPGERNAPWFWPSSYWFVVDFADALGRLAPSPDQVTSEQIEEEIRRVVAENPYLPRILPHVLDRGGGEARQLVFGIIQATETPETLETLYAFAQGRRGTDKMRMDMMFYLAQNHPHILPPDKRVTMWVKGKQTELIMLAFNITNEPQLEEDVSEADLRKFAEATDLIREDDLEAAESLLDEVIAANPDFPSVYNQLAIVYERTGRVEEARALLEEAHGRFPDYLFARTGLAGFYRKEERFEEAKDLLFPLLSREDFHYTEFQALANAFIELYLAEGEEEAARHWYEIWRKMEEDDPQLLRWKLRFDDESMEEAMRKALDRLSPGSE
jgi:tetratricopeptide (TPR) repeat protein